MNDIFKKNIFKLAHKEEEEILKYKQELKKNGTVVIRNLLEEESVDKLHNYFSFEMPEDWWHVTSSPNKDGIVETHYTRNTKENQEKILDFKKIAQETISSESTTFSYFFFRTVAHQKTCTCMECDFIKWLLDGEDFSNLLQKITGNKYSAPSDHIHATKYTEGCFLGPHTDSINGDLTCVFQMSKNWRSRWGGLLHFFDNDRTKIDQTEIPTYNSMTLFYLPKESTKLHLVSHVNPGVKSIRLAITAWLRKQEEQSEQKI